MNVFKKYTSSRWSPRSIIARGQWYIPFAAVSVFWILGSLVNFSARLDVMHSMMPATATAADHAEAQAGMLAYEPVRTAFLPIRILFGTGILSLMLYYFVRILEPPRPVRIAHSLAIIFMSDLFGGVGYLLAAMFPPAAMRFPIPSAPLSLQTWAESSSWVMNIILMSINPFQIAAIIAMGIWLSMQTEMGKVKSCCIAVALVSLSVFAQICLIQFTGTAVGLVQ